VERASIKSQCSRDYFYTKNPVFEKAFGAVEGEQRTLLDNIIATTTPPAHRSADRSRLSGGIMLQAGRTASAAAHADYLANQFGKAMLKHHLTKEGNTELLEYLPQVEITVPHGVMEAIGQNLAMAPLIDDLDCALFLNETNEDFLTSDHPIAMCNGLPGIRDTDRHTGFASRGLIILYPISPRALLFLSDAEAYKVEKNSSGSSTLKRPQDVIDLNLAQCRQAFENLYFASPARVQTTLQAFRRRANILRPRPSELTESSVQSEGRRGVLLALSPRVPRLSLPKPVHVRHAAKTGKYKVGDAVARDPVRVQLVHARLRKLREEATKMGEQQRSE